MILFNKDLLPFNLAFVRSLLYEPNFKSILKVAF